MLKSVIVVLVLIGIAIASPPTLSGYANEEDLTSASTIQGSAPSGYTTTYIYFYWTIDANKMSGGLVCKLNSASDWCGWGISAGGNVMTGTDAVIFWNDGSTGYGQQFYLGSKSLGALGVSCPEQAGSLKTCPTYDADSNCCNNVELVRADIQTDGSDIYLVAEWKRNLINSDAAYTYCSTSASQITAGDTKDIVWALGKTNSNPWPYNPLHHFVKSSVTTSITFSQDDSSTTPANPTCRAPTSGGDPHFGGFKGQKYDVMGQSYEVYNIITSPQLQINARFIPYYKNPGQVVPTGTMIGDLGVKFYSHLLYINPNTTTVTIDEQDISLTTDWSLSFDNNVVFSNAVNGRNYDVTIQTEILTITFKRKVYYVSGYEPQFHFDYKVETYQEGEMHGLLGQTWEDKLFANKQGAFKYLDGYEEDYRIKSNKIFGDDFSFNKFQNL